MKIARIYNIIVLIDKKVGLLASMKTQNKLIGFIKFFS